MVSFANLLGAVRAYNPETDADLLHRAYQFSAREHADQIRRSGEQYITHPLEVARLVAEMHLDDVTIAASLLHDVVEDTLTTIEKLRELFGPEIAHLVEGVTKISTIPFSSSEERQAENFRKMLLAMVDDVRVILVKLADRLHNMRTLGHLREERRRKIAQETIDIYAPIAHRLGMNKVKNELEELSLRHLDPRGYETLRARVNKRRRATERSVERLKRTLSDKLVEAGVPIVALEGRIKSVFSIWKKMKRQKISLDEVYDLLALRVVTGSVRDCYAALGIIHQTWAPVPSRFKDFVAMPRPNGYRSLHTAVVSDLGLPFEVQVRTSEMHEVAEDGIAAHWKYKEGRVGVEPDDKSFEWLRQILDEWEQETPSDPSRFIDDLKLDLYREEVYTFTPKGEVKALPRGATPIDFAYAIHTDVGHTCVGARVNGRMVPLRTPLGSGDIVEVITRAGNRPNRDWLNVAVTTRARNKIKHFIHAEEKLRAVELGRKLIEKEARRFDIKPKTVLDPEAVAGVCGGFGASKPDDLFAAVGYGRCSARDVLDALVPGEQRERPKPEKSLASRVRRVILPDQGAFKVGGVDDMMAYRAGCCSPIRGEKIVGYMTRGKGVSVHAASCPNVVNLFYDPERRIDVAWGRAGGAAAFTVSLTIHVEDRRGMIADVTARLADTRINICKVEASAGEDRHGQIDVTFDISDLPHLQRVIKVVRAVAGVLDVERVHRKP